MKFSRALMVKNIKNKSLLSRTVLATIVEGADSGALRNAVGMMVLGAGA